MLGTVRADSTFQAPPKRSLAEKAADFVEALETAQAEVKHGLMRARRGHELYRPRVPHARRRAPLHCNAACWAGWCSHRPESSPQTSLSLMSTTCYNLNVPLARHASPPPVSAPARHTDTDRRSQTGLAHVVTCLLVRCP